MTTAIAGRSNAIVRSDSSPSDDQPAAPRPCVSTELRDCAADEKRRIETEPFEHERDHRGRRRLAVRAGDDDRALQRDELGEELGASPPRHAAGERGGDDDLPAVAARLGSGEISTSIPPPDAREVRRVDAVPAADLGAPRARQERVAREAGAADADEPEPPTGERPQARSAPRRSRRPRAASPRRRIASRIASSFASSSSSSRDERAGAAELVVRHERSRRRHARSSCAFFVWWSPVAFGYGTSTAGSPAAAISQTVPPARASARSAARSAAPKRSTCTAARRSRRAVTRGAQRARSRARRRGAARPGPTRRTRSTAASFSDRAPASSPEDEQHAPVLRQPEARGGPPRAAPVATGDGIGRPTTRYFAPSRPSIGYARNTRRAKRTASRFARPRCASASVDRRRDPRRPGCDDHRARDVAARRRARRPGGGARGSRGTRAARAGPSPERPRELEPRSAREAGDRERVELVARLRNEPRLDALRRPGERHRRAARGERVRDRERGQHVPRRPAGRDQAPQLVALRSTRGDVKEDAHRRELRRRGSSRRRRRTGAGSRSAARPPAPRRG